jgi:hypothetical protein
MGDDFSATDDRRLAGAGGGGGSFLTLSLVSLRTWLKDPSRRFAMLWRLVGGGACS